MLHKEESSLQGLRDSDIMYQSFSPCIWGYTQETGLEGLGWCSVSTVQIQLPTEALKEPWHPLLTPAGIYP